MSLTKPLLSILQEQGPQSAEALSKIIEVDVAKVRAALNHMREYGYLDIRPATFVVTPRGEERSKHVANSPSTESRKRLQRKKDRKAGITAEAAKAVRQRETMVSKSIQNRPALEQAWGVFA